MRAAMITIIEKLVFKPIMRVVGRKLESGKLASYAACSTNLNEASMKSYLMGHWRRKVTWRFSPAEVCYVGMINMIVSLPVKQQWTLPQLIPPTRILVLF